MKKQTLNEDFLSKPAKKKKSKNIVIDNLTEEIQEILSPCIKCGMCKSLCPVFKVLKCEEVSPRGHSILLNEKIINELVFKCTLCMACEEKCPLNLKICDAMRKAREALANNEKGLKTNKKMIEEIRKNGNPFGKNAKIDSDKLYCC